MPHAWSHPHANEVLLRNRVCFLVDPLAGSIAEGFWKSVE